MSILPGRIDFNEDNKKEGDLFLCLIVDSRSIAWENLKIYLKTKKLLF